jgi:hypothetical protein
MSRKFPGATPVATKPTFGLLFETGNVGRIESILLAALQEHAVEQLTNSEAMGPAFPPPMLGPIFSSDLSALRLIRSSIWSGPARWPIPVPVPAGGKSHKSTDRILVAPY